MGVTATSKGNKAYRIIVTDRLTVHSIGEFQQNLPPENHPFREYVIDLRDIRQMDAAGLSLLLQFRHRTQSTGITPTLMVGVARIRDALNATQFDCLFSIVTAWEEKERGV